MPERWLKGISLNDNCGSGITAYRILASWHSSFNLPFNLELFFSNHTCAFPSQTRRFARCVALRITLLTHAIPFPPWASSQGKNRFLHHHKRAPRNRLVRKVHVHKSQFPFSLLTTPRSQAQQIVVIKSVRDHPRVENERNVLNSLQHRTPYLRQVIDEIEAPSTPSTIVLKHLDSDLLETSIRKSLNQKELKYVSRRVLEALEVLHEENYVHTGMYELSLGIIWLYGLPMS